MLNFYYVDKEYIDYLKKFDNKVPNVSYSTVNKFLCGVVLDINGIKYYAPISSKKDKQTTCIQIKNKNSVLSTIKFSFMIPVPDSKLKKLNFNQISLNDKSYVALLSNELRFCRHNEEQIIKKANTVYKIGCNKEHYLNDCCCDFIKLEEAMKNYK